MKAIWKIHHKGKDHWFGTRKEAKGFCEGAGIDETGIERIAIGYYLNPDQLINFIKTHFADCVSS